MKVHDLKPAPGSHKAKKRVARGIGGKGGKTAGRGTKGQRARGGIPAGFEGGQLPLHKRVPKLRGFNNPFRVEYQAINLDTIEESGLDEISIDTLRANGLVGKNKFVKVLGRGELSRKVTVKVHAVSKSAESAITGAGGTVEIVPLPWGDGRPPAKGNAHTNR
jgi:large subunit ribosomal protein L15